MLGTLFYSAVRKIFDILDRSGMAYTVWQTDRQTYRRTDGPNGL